MSGPDVKEVKLENPFKSDSKERVIVHCPPFAL